MKSSATYAICAAIGAGVGSQCRIGAAGGALLSLGLAWLLDSIMSNDPDPVPTKIIEHEPRVITVKEPAARVVKAPSPRFIVHAARRPSRA